MIRETFTRQIGVRRIGAVALCAAIVAASWGCGETRQFGDGSAGRGDEGGAGRPSSGAGGSPSAGTGAVGGAPPATGGSIAGNPDSGGTGASAGGGGASASGGHAGLAALGSSCKKNGECDSDHCVDGVCCDSPCIATCEQCGGDGHCGVAEDDEACGAVTCPASTDCAEYPSKLVEQRCLARGKCKSSKDCTATNVAVRTACGDDPHTICDGEGNCVKPTVGCQNITNCPVSSTGICCGHYSAGNGYAMCNISPASCAPEPAQQTIPVECDQTLDCAAGTICCYSIYKYGSSVRCVPPDKCVSDQSTLARQLCRMNDPAPVCPLGSTCTPADNTLESYMSLFSYCK